MQAKKSLGQHFLRSQKAIAQLVTAGSITKNDTIVEIGPGTGALTIELLKHAGTVIAIEKDSALVAHLKETFHEAITAKKLILLNEDILSFNTESLYFYGPSYKIIANIPYYITGAIIERFLSAPFQPHTMVLLMQKEVADRIVCKDKKESILSIAVKVYGTPTYIGTVPPGAFVPPPKVQSAIIKISSISKVFFETIDGRISESFFFDVVTSLFGKKRKQIGGSLATYLNTKESALHILDTAHLDPTRRPETLTSSEWKSLTQHIQEHKNTVQ